MAEMIELKEQEERVILVAVSTDDNDDTVNSVQELSELVSTAGAVTVGTVIQNRENIHPGTYVGKGKMTNPRRQVKFDKSKGKDVVTYLYDIVMENELPDYLQYDFGLTK